MAVGNYDFFSGLTNDEGVDCGEIVDAGKGTAGVAALRVGNHF